LERSTLVFSVIWGSLATPGVANAAGSLNLNPDLRILIANVIVFLAIVYPTNRFVLKPLLKVLRDRTAAVEGTAARASELRDQGAAQRAELEGQLAAARAAAQAERANIVGEGEAEEKRLIDIARSEGLASVHEMRDVVAAELVSARAALEVEARSLAGEAASKILGRTL
jgi:F-type H+-transporting ATPase subunit b